MANIRPFKALRPKPALAKLVASRPYDVLNSAEAREEAADNPYSFLHITKSEINLPPTEDSHSEAVYKKAKENLEIFMKEGILFNEDKPCYYIYRLVMNGRGQDGLVCVSSIDDYNNGIIKKHEFTRPDKELDRINHIKITGAQTGNVFLAYKNVATIDAIIDKWKSAHEPMYNFAADDGIQHTIWVIDNENVIHAISELFTVQVGCTYIADGHHRAASAAKVKKALGEKAPAGADYFLTTLFPSSQLRIMDYNRVVKDLHGKSEQDFLQSLQKDFTLEKASAPLSPAGLHEFGMYLNRQWYKLTTREGTFSTDPIGVLDVTILSNNILDKILGIKDQRTDKRIDFIGGIRGLAELQKRVDSREMAVAFSLYPVSIQQLFDIADSDEVMPPKSTWFEPKLRDGLLTHLMYV